MAAAFCCFCLLVETGTLKLPLPYPAQHEHLWQWAPEASFVTQTPQMPPFTLPLQQLAVRLFDGQLQNVETVTGDPATGDLLLPDKWGNVYLAQRMPNGSYTLQQPPLARMGPGRVLGSKLDAQGNLIMCDVLKGLLRLNRTSGELEQLAARVADDDSPITYANGLDVVLNGSIYFTASTDVLPARSPDGSYDTGFAWVLSNFRGLPRGRVLVWHPHTRRAHVVASGFYYSDGVAVADDGSYLLVVETDTLRVVKLWLTGDKAGTREVIIHSLPGLPAGVSKASDGNFWLSMTVPLPPVTKYLRPILLRAVVAWMPRSWRPAVRVWGAVLKISPQGKVLQVLLDPKGEAVATASAATEVNGRLFLGSLMGGPFISYVELSELQQVEQQLQELHAAQNQSTAGTNPTTTSIDWSSVGGKSLHDQQDVWGNQARARHTQQS